MAVYAQGRRLVTVHESGRVDLLTPAEAEAERDEQQARRAARQADYDDARAWAIADLLLSDAEWLAAGEYRTCGLWSYTEGQEGGVFRCGDDGRCVSARGVLRALRANDSLASVLRQVDRDEDITEEWGA